MLQVKNMKRISINGEEVENNTFGFFDPDHDENLKNMILALI